MVLYLTFYLSPESQVNYLRMHVFKHRILITVGYVH